MTDKKWLPYVGNARQLSMYGEHVILAQGSVHLSDVISLKRRYL